MKHYTKILLLALLLFTTGKPATASAQKTFFTGLAHLYLFTYLSELLQSIAYDPYLYTPTSFNTHEEYLELVEKKLTDWAMLLAKPTEEELATFRKSLIKIYKDVLVNRPLLSMIIDADISSHPWALLASEIKQHKDRLEWYYIKIDAASLFKSEEDRQSTQNILNRIKAITETLDQILDTLEYRTDFQSECSQARQEKIVTSTKHLVTAFFLVYMGFHILDNIHRID